MITIQFEVTAKPDRINDILDFARRSMEMTHSKDSGFQQYVFHQRLDDPRKFSLWEKWDDVESLDVHIANLHKTFGQPLPAGRLPAILVEASELIEVFLLDEVK
ncbi:MAG: antibiotic biosynthesis monooxygenase [Chitinophagales bacterium]|nr:antibiotic biosynthesis monooxygenase [Hyphomicrobiales bacterium]